MDNLFNRLIDLAAACPDKKAVVFKGEYLTYRELCRRIAGMAERLGKEGVGQGDRVCFSAVSKPEMVAAYMAVQACGAVAVFLDKNGTPENMAAHCPAIFSTSSGETFSPPTLMMSSARPSINTYQGMCLYRGR